MASRSRSPSPFHSNMADNRTSPTPHSTAVSSTSNIHTGKKKFEEGKYHITINNVPNEWNWYNVSAYVKKYTDCVDKDLKKDITFIVLKAVPYSLQEGSIQFKTEWRRDQAYQLLKSTTDKINGKKLYVHKDDVVKIQSQSPFIHESNLGNNQSSLIPTPNSAASNTAREIGWDHHLRLVNVPVNWKWGDVLFYVKKHTTCVDKAIAKDISFIQVKKIEKSLLNSSLLHFKTEQFRDQAFQLLKQTTETVNGKKLNAYKSRGTCQLKAPGNWSQSPLHNDSNLSNDRASPTPSHASAGSISDPSAKFPKRKRILSDYHLRLDNVPEGWRWSNVSDYLKRHTDPVNTAIADDVTYIRVKKDANVTHSFIDFKAEHFRNQAFDLLIRTRDKFNGRRIYVTKLESDQSNQIASGNWSQSPLHNDSIPSNDRASPTPSHASAVSTISDTSAKMPIKRKFVEGDYHLRLDNVPDSWKWHDVSDYLKKHTDPVDKAIAEDITFIRIKNISNSIQCLIEFKTLDSRNQAFRLLKHSTDKVNGKKIFAYKIAAPHNQKKYKPMFETPEDIPSDLTTDLTDEEYETYGLSVEFLTKLGITLPLTRKVLVQNLPIDCEESKAYTVFSLAGNVETLSLLTQDSHYNAIVEYEHPLEAVQAVSMFNKQEIFGKEITCQMTVFQTNIIEGMSVHGPGLGPNGAPLKGIRLSIEIQKLKEEIMAEYNTIMESSEELEAQIDSLIQENDKTRAISMSLQATSSNVTDIRAIFSNLLTNQWQPQLQTLAQLNTGNSASEPNTGNSASEPNTGNSASEPNTGNSASEPNTGNSASEPNTGNSASGTLLQNAAPSNIDQSQEMTNQSETEPMQVDTNMQSDLNSKTESNQTVQNMQISPANTQDNQGNSKGKTNFSPVLQFTNLPPSVTYPVLHSKMLQVGQVKFIQMGQKGRALVHFFSSVLANKALELFDKSKVDGQIIEVKEV